MLLLCCQLTQVLIWAGGQALQVLQLRLQAAQSPVSLHQCRALAQLYIQGCQLLLPQAPSCFTWAHTLFFMDRICL